MLSSSKFLPLFLAVASVVSAGLVPLSNPPPGSNFDILEKPETPKRSPFSSEALRLSRTPSTETDNSGFNVGGVATFFEQEGLAGECGVVHQDSDLIGAIDLARFSSTLCGQQVLIVNTNNGKSVTITIADECPICENSNSFDLSIGAFEQIATLEDGEVPIEWEFL